MAMIGKEIWIVWSTEGDDEYFSTKAKAYARCVELINEIMCDDAEERAECLLELAEYDNVEYICGFHSDFIDANDKPKKKETELREKKYHIYHRTSNNVPFCINGKILEFDNYESANRFICMLERYIVDFSTTDYYMREDVVYSPYGYMDATTVWLNK